MEGVEAVTCSCSQSPRAASVCRMMLGACSSAGPLQAWLAVPSPSAVGPACVMQWFRCKMQHAEWLHLARDTL